MVSEKMIEVINNKTIRIWDETSKQVAQAVVNAAWTKYKFDDKSTWPNVVPHQRLIQRESGLIESLVWCGNSWEGAYTNIHNDDPIEYHASHESLMFKGEEDGV